MRMQSGENSRMKVQNVVVGSMQNVQADSTADLTRQGQSRGKGILGRLAAPMEASEKDTSVKPIESRAVHDERNLPSSRV